MSSAGVLLLSAPVSNAHSCDGQLYSPRRREASHKVDFCVIYCRRRGFADASFITFFNARRAERRRNEREGKRLVWVADMCGNVSHVGARTGEKGRQARR